MKGTIWGWVLVGALAVGLGASLVALWRARQGQAGWEATLAALEVQGAAQRDSLLLARAQVDSLGKLVGFHVGRYQALRAGVRFQPGTAPGAGPVAVIEGDTTEHPLPPQIIQIIRACDSIVPACTAGMMKATAALDLSNRRAETAESALKVWEAAPPKKPFLGFKEGVLVGSIVILTMVLVLN